MKCFGKNIFFLFAFCLIATVPIKSQSFQSLQIKEFYDNLEDGILNMNSYDPLDSKNKANTLGDGVSKILDSYIRMYKTTKDKAYLYKFMKQTMNIQSLRGTYSGTFDCAGCEDHGNVSWSPSFYHNGLILWPMAHFVHLVKIEDPALKTELLNYPPGLIINNSFTTFEDFANWLGARVSESLILFIITNWMGDDQAFKQETNDKKSMIINMQSGFGAALLYMGQAFGISNFLVKAKKMAELYMSSVDLRRDNDCPQTGEDDVTIPGECFSLDVLQTKTNNSYWWYHAGWNIRKKIRFTCPFTKRGECSTYTEFIEDISHGIQTLIFPLVAFKTQLSSGSTTYFTNTEMTRFRNTFAKNLYDGAGNFHLGVNGTNQVHPDVATHPSDLPSRILNWMPFYKFDVFDASPEPVYDIIMNYYVNNINNIAVNILSNPATGAQLNGISEVVAAQWDKECTDLTLYNREVVYDQDFFAKNDLIVDPTGGPGTSYADPEITTPEFTIEQGVTVNMTAVSKIVGKTGFHAKAGSNVHVYIDPTIDCGPGKWSGSSNSQANSDNPITLPDEQTVEGDAALVQDSTQISKKETKISIYPNPTPGKFNLSINETKADKVLIVVVDMLGIERYSKVFVLEGDNYTLAIDPAGKLTAGVYMVIAASENNLYRKKIVIQ